MIQDVVKISKPGDYTHTITFGEVGQEQMWTGIIDARQPGVYELTVVATHTAQGTRGRITVRAVCGAGARVAVRGLIRIAKEAQDTDDFLELRVLTLDKTALATAEPELEIEANQVKASHAASVGPVDEEQLLYLMSRGLSRAEAVDTIVRGFLA